MIAQVPELADGGYWYVLAKSETDDLAPGWCAWHDSIGHTVVRSVVSQVVRENDLTIESVLGEHWEKKPYGRVGEYQDEGS